MNRVLMMFTCGALAGWVFAHASVGTSGSIHASLHRDVGEMEWDASFGWEGHDYGQAIERTDDGGYVLVGYTNSVGSGSDDFWAIRTNSRGEEVWNRTYGGSGSDRAYGVTSTTDGGFALVGRSGSVGSGDAQIWLVRIDRDGNQLWNCTYGDNWASYGYCVRETIDGGYVISGIAFSGQGEGEAWLIRVDPEGNEIWNRKFGGAGQHHAFSVRQTIDEGFVFTGQTLPRGGGSRHVLLGRTDANGAEEWLVTLGQPGSPSGKDVVEMVNGDFLVTGFTTAYTDSYDGLLLRADPHGNQLEEIAFGGEEADYFRAIRPTHDGGFVLCGETASQGLGGADYWIVKLDSILVEQWEQTFGSEDYEHGYGVQQTIDGGYVIYGSTDGPQPKTPDAWLVKTQGLCGISGDIVDNPDVVQRGDQLSFVTRLFNDCVEPRSFDLGTIEYRGPMNKTIVAHEGLQSVPGGFQKDVVLTQRVPWWTFPGDYTVIVRILSEEEVISLDSFDVEVRQ